MHDGNPLGLVELTGHFGQQLVGRHADRTGQTGLVEDGFLDQAREHAPAFALAARHMGKVNVDLVHTPVFHHRRDVGHDGLESAGVLAVLGKVYRQQNGLRAQPGGFHQAHGRAHAKLPRRVGGGGDHATPGVAGQPWEKIDGDAAQVGRGPEALWPFIVQPRQQIVFAAAAAANHHRKALELRVAQQLNRRVKSVHVQVSDAPDEGAHGRQG